MPEDTNSETGDGRTDQNTTTSKDQPFEKVETRIGDATESGGADAETSTEQDESDIPTISATQEQLEQTFKTVGSDVDEHTGTPEHLRGKHPADLTLKDLEHPSVSEEARQQAIETLPHLQEQLEKRESNQQESNTNDSNATDNRVHHELETEHEGVNTNTVVRVITGRSDRMPTIEQVRDAYANNEISEAEMEAILPEAIKREANTESASESTYDSQTAIEGSIPESVQAGDDGNDSTTLQETGLLNDADEFPWEDEEVISEGAELGEQSVLKFRYKRVPFEVTDPENKEQYENKLSLLENFDDLESGKREAQARRFARELADDVLTVDGVPHAAVYQIEHPHRGKLVIGDQDGSKGLADHPRATKIWDAMNWYDRMMIGQRMGQWVQGDAKFRQRRR